VLARAGQLLEHVSQYLPRLRVDSISALARRMSPKSPRLGADRLLGDLIQGIEMAIELSLIARANRFRKVVVARAQDTLSTPELLQYREQLVSLWAEAHVSDEFNRLRPL